VGKEQVHHHAVIHIYNNGILVQVPPNVGWLPQDKTYSSIHTHTPDGIIHVEAPRDRSFTLGDFFAVWGQPLDKTHVATASTKKRESMRVFVNGVRYTGNPAQIPLTAHADIVIEVGPPFRKHAPFTNWGAL
jgi:hypothetical protein